jgi:hypothetical protein
VLDQIQLDKWLQRATVAVPAGMDLSDEEMEEFESIAFYDVVDTAAAAAAAAADA